jgi:putative membrane protein
MNEFADGVAKFDEEGIQSLAELAGPEYLEVIRRVRAARDAEHRYDNFSGILDGQKGSVRFMIETEEISAQTDD